MILSSIALIFDKNIQLNIPSISLTNFNKENIIKKNLLQLTQQGISLINNAVMINATGSIFKDAGGISIYFPELRILDSYQRSSFALNNKWSKVLSEYMFSQH